MYVSLQKCFLFPANARNNRSLLKGEAKLGKKRETSVIFYAEIATGQLISDNALAGRVGRFELEIAPNTLIRGVILQDRERPGGGSEGGGGDRIINAYILKTANGKDIGAGYGVQREDEADRLIAVQQGARNGHLRRNRCGLNTLGDPGRSINGGAHGIAAPGGLEIIDIGQVTEDPIRDIFSPAVDVTPDLEGEGTGNGLVDPVDGRNGHGAASLRAVGSMVCRKCIKGGGVQVDIRAQGGSKLVDRINPGNRIVQGDTQLFMVTANTGQIDLSAYERCRSCTVGGHPQDPIDRCPEISRGRCRRGLAFVAIFLGAGKKRHEDKKGYDMDGFQWHIPGSR